MSASHDRKFFDTFMLVLGILLGITIGLIILARIIADLLPTRHKLGVWGDGWEGKLPPGVWQGRFVPWEKLPLIYSCATIVLNDHQPEMLKNGFVNNRTARA